MRQSMNKLPLGKQHVDNQRPQAKRTPHGSKALDSISDISTKCRYPCQRPLTFLHRFATLESVTSANPAHPTHAHGQLHVPTSKFIAWLPNPLAHAFRNFHVVGSQRLHMDFHSWKSNFRLMPEQHYNNQKHIQQLCPHVGPKPVEAMLLCTGQGRSENPPHPYEPLGL